MLNVVLALRGCGGNRARHQSAEPIELLFEICPRRIGSGICARTCTRLLTKHLARTELTDDAQHARVLLQFVATDEGATGVQVIRRRPQARYPRFHVDGVDIHLTNHVYAKAKRRQHVRCITIADAIAKTMSRTLGSDCSHVSVATVDDAHPHPKLRAVTNTALPRAAATPKLACEP